MPINALFSAIIGLVIGILATFLVVNVLRKNKVSTIEAQAQSVLQKAQDEEKKILSEAEQQSKRLLDSIQREEQDRKRRLQEIEQKQQKREKEIEQQINTLHQTERELNQQMNKVREEENTLHQKQKEAETVLQKISSLSPQEAKEILLKKVEEEHKADLVQHIEKVVNEAKVNASEQVKNILAEAMQRYYGESIAESTITTVPLPNDEMKGRIIGREGRNINAFEKLSGVDLIVDDTPGAVILSGFDLIRRYVAKIALERLVADGRIHPTKIEETILKAQEDVTKMMKEFGEKVVYELGITGLPNEILKLLGRLRFRTAYGQNILKHSVEVAKLAANIATELGANVDIAKRAGLLHDIGKALDQEIDGHHSEIGQEICKKYHLPTAIAGAIASHHGDVPFTSIEGIIVYIANAISHQRQGAQRDSLEQHVQRMTNLEQTALAFDGVEQAFAIQAGKELRIIVNPTVVSDVEAYKLAHDLAKELEKSSGFSGEIKVNVVRETRIIEYAR